MIFATPWRSHQPALNQIALPSVAMVPISAASIQKRPSAIDPRNGARTSSRARALVMMSGSGVMAPSREGALQPAENGVGLVGHFLPELGRIAELVGIVNGQMLLDIGAQFGDARIVHQVQRGGELDDGPDVLDQAVAERVLDLAGGRAAKQAQDRKSTRLN